MSNPPWIRRRSDPAFVRAVATEMEAVCQQVVRTVRLCGKDRDAVRSKEVAPIDVIERLGPAAEAVFPPHVRDG